MAQAVRIDRAQTGASSRGGHRLRHTRRAQAPVRCLDADEHPLVQGVGRPALLQVVGDRLTDITRQRKPIAAISLPHNDDLAAAPIDVVQPQAGTIESINFQLRKITKTRGHFPSDEAAMKLLYLGLRNISSKRGGESGTGTHGWKTALNTLIVHLPGRLPL